MSPCWPLRVYKLSIYCLPTQFGLLSFCSPPHLLRKGPTTPNHSTKPASPATNSPLLLKSRNQKVHQLYPLFLPPEREIVNFKTNSQLSLSPGSIFMRYSPPDEIIPLQVVTFTTSGLSCLARTDDSVRVALPFRAVKVKPNFELLGNEKRYQ